MRPVSVATRDGTDRARGEQRLLPAGWTGTARVTQRRCRHPPHSAAAQPGGPSPSPKEAPKTEGAKVVSVRFASPDGRGFDSLQAAINYVRGAVGGHVGGGELYLVRGVLAQRVCRKKQQVLVHWKGWKREQATWEPICQIPKQFIDQFRNGEKAEDDGGQGGMDFDDEPEDAAKFEAELRESVRRGEEEGAAWLDSVWKRLGQYANVDRISLRDWDALKDVIVIPHSWCRVCASTRANTWQASIYGPQSLCGPCSEFVLQNGLLLPLREPTWPNSILPDRPSQRDLEGVSAEGSLGRTENTRVLMGQACSVERCATAKGSKSASSHFHFRAEKTSRTPRRCTVGAPSSASPLEPRTVLQGRRKERAEARGRSTSAKGNKYAQSSRARKAAKISHSREDVKGLRKFPERRMSRLAVRQGTRVTLPSQPETCAEDAHTTPDSDAHQVRDTRGTVKEHTQPAAEMPVPKDGLPNVDLPFPNAARTPTTLVHNFTPRRLFSGTSR